MSHQSDALTTDKRLQCAARRQSLPEPADCNWPVCGCDDHASKVIEALTESGWHFPSTRLAFSYDDQTDTLTVSGVKYAGELFRALGFGPVDSWIKIVKRDDGVLTIFNAPKGARIAWEEST